MVPQRESGGRAGLPLARNPHGEEIPLRGIGSAPPCLALHERYTCETASVRCRGSNPEASQHATQRAFATEVMLLATRLPGGFFHFLSFRWYSYWCVLAARSPIVRKLCNISTLLLHIPLLAELVSQNNICILENNLLCCSLIGGVGIRHPHKRYFFHSLTCCEEGG